LRLLAKFETQKKGKSRSEKKTTHSAWDTKWIGYFFTVHKGSNRLKVALRQTANVIGNLKEGHLNNFFRRINYKKGRATAVSATARKLAVIIWNMLTKTEQYQPPTEYLFLDQKRKMKLVN